jgi:hypothetical protein
MRIDGKDGYMPLMDVTPFIRNLLQSFYFREKLISIIHVGFSVGRT